jgi:site-specific recombinase XerD
MPKPIALDALTESWTLTLEAEAKSPRTVGNYRDSLELFVRWLVDGDHPLDPDRISTGLLRTWLIELKETRSASTSRTR